MFLLEQNTKKKGKVDKKIAIQLEFDISVNNKEYKMEGICNSVVYAKKLETSHLSGLYYLVF